MPQDAQHGRRSPRGHGGRRTQDDLFHTDTSQHAISRYGFLAGAFGLSLALIGARLLDYQVINRGENLDKADDRRRGVQTLFAKRGTIYDRNGKVLATCADCFNVYINAQNIAAEDRARVVRTLSRVLGIKRDAIRDAIDSNETFRYIKRQVDVDEVELIKKEKLTGVEFEPALKRVYPNGSLASQVIGVCDVDNKGLTGLEKQYDEILTGKNGWLDSERGRMGDFIAGGAYHKVPAQDGMDIMVGIDANIQRVCEDALAEGVENAGAKYGSIIMTDPKTGEIIAACSNPTYDPGDLASASNADMNLRVVSDAYEPGSVFKTFVCAAGIDQGLITPDTTFHVPAVVKAGDDDVRDVDKRDFAVDMDVREILRRSSNTGMVLVGQKIGADKFAKHVISDFGFGKATGVDFPGESLGIVKKRSEYDGASVAAMSFGQALAVSPVEMVRAMSAIANDGIMTTPHFLKTRAGEEVDWTDGETRACGAEAARTVADMMRTVVDEGTGQEAAIKGYEISGKTGTAERAGESGGYEENNNMASFMGFVSTQDPRALCYITLDGTPNTSHAALPIFKKVMEAALPELGIKPTR